MRLFQLAYACRIYGGLTQFDVGYLRLLDKTGGALDFRNSVHMKALLVWLNSWGCRQFAVDHHDSAAESILRWAGRWESRLPDRFTTLDRLSDRSITDAGDAFADLSQCLASRRTRNDKQYDVQVGPTGAAKILFAARPRAFPPWDDPIREYLGLDGTRRSYCEYLAQVREQIKQLCNEAADLGIPAETIPQEVGRPRSTLPKLIDEYNWVTATRGFSPAEPNDIAKWYRWSRQLLDKRRCCNISRYDPLARYLESQSMTTSSLGLDFQEIEKILGFRLPDSARRHRSWWGNDTRHTQTVWLKAGWQLTGVDMTSQRVTFVRTGSCEREHRAPAAALSTEHPGSEATTRGLRPRIGLIACTKAKLNRPAPARELYSASDLFRKAAAYCDAHLDGWFVLSAKYGLVEPSRVLEPYDVTLKTMPNSERKRWGAHVARQLRQLGDAALEAHAGADYVRPLLEAGVVLDEPLRGLAIGKRKRWYMERLP